MSWLLLTVVASFSSVAPFWLNNFEGLLVDLKNEIASEGLRSPSGNVDVENPDALLEELKAQISRFVPVRLNPAQEAFLDDTEKKVLSHLVDAASLMDPIYERQVWRLLANLKTSLSASSASSSLAKHRLQYLDIMRGPWDRLQNNTPVAVEVARPLGGGFYPSDDFFTPEFFRSYLSAQEEEREALESPYTMVVAKKRSYPPSLEALPYSQVFSEWLVPAGELLRKASSLMNSTGSLSSYLSSTAQAFTTNTFSNISQQETDAERYRIQIAIGPTNQEEDTYFGLKGAFESYVYILDQEFKESQSRAGSTGSPLDTRLHSLLRPDSSQISLPQGLALSRTLQQGGRVEIGELVFCSGAARKPLQSAVVKMEEEAASRRVVFSNVIEAQYNHLLEGVAGQVMKAKQVNDGLLSSDAYLMLVVWQELAKTFRRVYEAEEGLTTPQAKVTDSVFDIIAEAKSELLGIHSLLKEIRRENYTKDFDKKVMFTYMTHLLRLASSGGNTKARAAAALQLNKLLDQAGLTLVPDRRYQVNFRKVEAALIPTITQLLTVLDSGDSQAALELVRNYGGVSATMTTVFQKLENSPLDVKPVFYQRY